jgi:hypothetical protein
MALVSGLTFMLAVLWLYICHALLGWPTTAVTLQLVFYMALRYLLVTIGSAALASITVYSLQRPTFAMVFYILLSMNVIGGFANAFLRLAIGGKVAEAVASRLLFGVTERILIGLLGAGQLWQPAFEYLAYVVLSLTISLLIFNRKEIEFKP